MTREFVDSREGFEYDEELAHEHCYGCGNHIDDCICCELDDEYDDYLYDTELDYQNDQYYGEDCY